VNAHAAIALVRQPPGNDRLDIHDDGLNELAHTSQNIWHEAA
jgi:hypothetical protein